MRTETSLALLTKVFPASSLSESGVNQGRLLGGGELYIHFCKGNGKRSTEKMGSILGGGGWLELAHSNCVLPSSGGG